MPAIGDDGEALWPDRFPREVLEAIRIEKGEYWWSALYQQRPTPRKGLTFNTTHVEIVDAAPAGLECVRAWDNAATKGAGDYTAGVKMGVTKNGLFYVLDVVRGQWATDERNAIFHQTAQIDGLKVRIRGVRDPGSAGADSALFFTRLLVGFAVKVQNVTGPKQSRAEPFAGQVNVGNVKLVRGAWNRDFLEELRSFPR